MIILQSTFAVSAILCLVFSYLASDWQNAGTASIFYGLGTVISLFFLLLASMLPPTL